VVEGGEGAFPCGARLIADGTRLHGVLNLSAELHTAERHALLSGRRRGVSQRETFRGLEMIWVSGFLVCCCGILMPARAGRLGRL